MAHKRIGLIHGGLVLTPQRAAQIIKTSKAIAEAEKVQLAERAAPEEYLYIRLYGEMNGTLDYTIRAHQQIASSSRAPLDVVSYDMKEGMKTMKDISIEERSKMYELHMSKLDTK